MAGKGVTGLAAAAGSFIGLVIGAGVAQVLSKRVDTYETKTATLVLGSLTGMAGGAFVAAAIAAEPESSAPAGTAGIPKGLGATPTQHVSAGLLYRYLRSNGCDCSAQMRSLTRNFQIDWNAGAYSPRVTPAPGTPQGVVTSFAANGQLVTPMPLVVDGEFSEQTLGALNVAVGGVTNLTPCYFNGVGPCDRASQRSGQAPGQPVAPHAPVRSARTFGCAINSQLMPRA